MYTKTPPKDLQAIWHDFVADNFQNMNIESVIDIGSGWGKSKERLQRITPNVKTQDINRALMTTVDYVLPPSYLSKKYDLVTSFDVFEHISDFELECWMLDLIRITKTHLFITTPNGIVHSKLWHYKPRGFLNLVRAYLCHHVQGGMVKFRYFLRHKLTESDNVKEVSENDFLKTKDANGLGLHIEKVE